MTKKTGGSPPHSASAVLPLSLRRLPFLLPLLIWSSFPSQSRSQGTPAATAVAGEERRILLQMKAEWGNPPALRSWNGSSSPCGGGWNGVTCNSDGSVTGVSLVLQGIRGVVPNVTCSLRNLSTLNLYYNYIGGPFPTVLYDCPSLQYLNISNNLFVGEIPSDVHRLSKLTFLDLCCNNFTGDIPAAISKIPGLRLLKLDANLFNGTFPKELGSMTELESLSLANNPFTPMELPAELGNLGNLKFLWVAEANLVGGIPESLGNLTELEQLDLSINQLNGSIPDKIWQLGKLKFLYLHHNHLSGTIAGAGIAASNLTSVDLSRNYELGGPIPEDFGKLPNLRNLYLYDNQFSGPIPDGIGMLPALSDLRLYNNNLTGVLPPELGKHSQLLNLEVCGNRLSGELPEDLCAGGVLNSLVAFENRLTGSLPKSLGGCGSLKNLQLYGNNFSGEMPAGIWALEYLSIVIIHGNMLSGELPSSLPRNLSRLEMENNRFYGRLPSSASKLMVFRASNNQFSGEIPVDLTGIAELEELLLDGNLISGAIPPGIAKLRSLNILNLSANRLTGSIPGDIGSLPGLTSLDLSGNQLSGGIPFQMGDLKLNFLNLSSNSLTGQVPEALQNQAFDRSFFSNSGLCSSTNSLLKLPRCGTKDGRPDGLSKGLLTFFLVLGVVVFLVTAVFGFVVVRDLRRRKRRVDLASWKLTSFQTLDFAEANIVRGLAADRLIGTGGSGQVYRVPLGNRAGEVVAVKKIWNNRKLDWKLEKEFEAEVRILGSIRHNNIVKLLCCISSPDSKLLVYEYMANGSLHQWLHGRGGAAGGDEEMGWPSGERRQGGVLGWPARLSVALGAARGLCYMHHDCSPPIVHRDIKSSNILLDAEFWPKVADFGLARMLVRPGEPDTVSAVAGSFGYMAPECAYTRVNEKVDVYSFGVVLLELVTGKRAHEGDGDGGLAAWAWQYIQEGKPVAGVLDESIRDPLYLEEMTVVLKLGLICTGTLPSTRPSMKEVLQVLLRCARMAEDGDKAGREYDAAPLLQDVRKKHSRRKSHADADDGDEEEESSSLACRVRP